MSEGQIIDLLADIKSAIHRVADAIEDRNEIRERSVSDISGMLDKHLRETNNPVSHLKQVDSEAGQE